MKRLIAILALAVPVTVAGVLLYPRTAQPAGVLGEVARQRPERLFPARFSVPIRYQRCTAVPLPADGTIPRETCGERGDAPTDMVRLAGEGKSLDPDTLHGSALVTIAWWNGEEGSLDDVIQRLSLALLLAGDSVPLLVDLSAAYLARAQQAQSPLDLNHALDTASRALAADSSNQAACWNKALAAAAMGMKDEAASAFNAYLRLDRRSSWASEARRRLSLLPDPPSAESDPSDADLARTSILRWDSILGEWGSAVLADSTARAQTLLAQAESLGRAQALRGDRSLADAVEAIRLVHDPAVKRTLAEAHRVLSAGLGLFPATMAQDSFARVLELQPPSAALRAWAEALYAIPNGVAIESVLSNTDSSQYPLLTARLHWIWGRAFFNNGKYDDANIHFQAAARTYGRLRESEGYGATRGWEGWSLYELGDTLAAYKYAHQALSSLRRAGAADRTHMLFVDMGQYAARQGMYHAAVVIANQITANARQRNDAADRAEAMLTRVMLQKLAGESGPMRPTIDSAAVLISALPEEDPIKQELTNILRYTRVMQWQAGRMEDSVAAELDSAIAFFSQNQKEVWRVAALIRRAEEHLHAGNHALAHADLNSITTVFQRNAGNERALHLRAAVIEEARGLFDQLVMLHIRNERPREALRALERGRVSLAPISDARASSDGRLTAPPGESVVEYALISDTLLVWTVRDTAVTLLRQRVDGDSLRLVIEQTNAALEQPGREAAALPHLMGLYDLLIRPVRDRLTQDSTLVIIADGEIAGVPLAALRDRTRNRFLVQDHPVRYAATLAHARDAAPPAPLDAAVQALLVANPTFDADEYSDLDPLPGARGEMDSLLRLYPGADTLADAAATVSAFWASAPGKDVIHYAGHAVFDDTRPERSFLVLAGRGDAGRLRADSASALDLGGVRIVVLSACSTLRRRRGRSGGFSGLSGALLSAGAGGVVGSVWKVNDERVHPLMVRFHQAYRESGDGARALRAAQLVMIGGDVDLSLWAGFRYMGR